MGVQTLSHEVAFATSQRVVRVFAPLLREEEQVEAMNEVYPLVKEALRTFAERLDRERLRLGRRPQVAPPPVADDAPVTPGEEG